MACDGKTMSLTAEASPENSSGKTDEPTGTSALAARVEQARDLIEKSRLAIPGEYRFDWQGGPVSLSLAPADDGGDTVCASLTCCLGLLPYTVEDREGRANAVDMAMRVNIRGWDHIRFTPAGGLELRSECLLPAPADMAALIGSLTAWLICLDRDLMPLRMLLRPEGLRQAA